MYAYLTLWNLFSLLPPPSLLKGNTGLNPSHQERGTKDFITFFKVFNPSRRLRLDIKVDMRLWNCKDQIWPYSSGRQEQKFHSQLVQS